MNSQGVDNFIGRLPREGCIKVTEIFKTNSEVSDTLAIFGPIKSIKRVYQNENRYYITDIIYEYYFDAVNAMYAVHEGKLLNVTSCQSQLPKLRNEEKNSVKITGSIYNLEDIKRMFGGFGKIVLIHQLNKNVDIIITYENCRHAFDAFENAKINNFNVELI